jgi:hypothetical protein
MNRFSISSSGFGARHPWTYRTTATSALSKAVSRDADLDQGNNTEPYLADDDMKADANERLA